jgi:arylsulfatase A-like enzyme
MQSSRGLTRRTLLQTTAVAAAGAAIGVGNAQSASAASTGRPNVVLILADDMGFSDIGRYGSEIPTPNIDRIAGEGATFTQFYNNGRCCPTRASALTGLYPTQAGVGYMAEDQGHPGYQGRLNDSCVTIAEVLKDAGYRTSMSGKWHVGTWQNGVIPATRGFDRSYGPVGGKSSYFRPQLYRNADPIGRPTELDYYLTDALADDAVDAINEFAGGDEPFFSYVAFTSPHWPLHAPEADVELFRGHYLNGWDALRRARFDRQRQIGLLSSVSELPPRDPDAKVWEEVTNPSWQDRRMAVYAAQIHRMDVGVGRILDALETTGVRDNTLVLFLSDNGGCAEVLGKNAGAGTVSVDGSPVRSGNSPSVWPGPSNTYASYGLEWAHASNTPFTRYKHYTDEGGLSTPLVASWPARVAAGRVVDKPLHLIDLAPTILEATGAAYPAERGGRAISPLEGRSFLRIARGSDPGGWTHGRTFFWEHEGNRAVRKGTFKLVARYDEPWRMYDLTRDRAETRNLADGRPGTVAELDAEWRAWATRVKVRQWNPETQYA